ncbi:MAG: hypothetical protein ABI625_19605 [bacterium]
MFERKILVACLAATLATALACGGDQASQSPLAPVGGSSALRGGIASARGNSGQSYHATTCSTQKTVNASGVFGPAGGTLTFGSSRLIIPGGALQDTVTISATIPDGDESHVEFQPHGLQFAKPAGLLLGVEGCAIDESAVPDVVYLSESGEILELIPAVYDPHWHTFAASIWHFSGYAIAF